MHTRTTSKEGVISIMFSCTYVYLNVCFNPIMCDGLWRVPNFCGPTNNFFLHQRGINRRHNTTKAFKWNQHIISLTSAMTGLLLSTWRLQPSIAVISANDDHIYIYPIPPVPSREGMGLLYKWTVDAPDKCIDDEANSMTLET